MPLPNSITLLQRFLPSRQLLPGSWANAIREAFYSFQSLAPLGVGQADAAVINAANIEIPAGSAAAGIRLPPSYPGASVSILNNSANTQNIYPAGTERIQNAANGYAAASAAVTAATNTSYVFFCVKAGFWQRSVTS